MTSETLAAAKAAGTAVPRVAHAHRSAVLLMLAATFLWSIAGVFTRHLETAKSFEVTFWRSFFAFLFMIGTLLWQHRRPRLVDSVAGAASAVRASGRAGLLSGAMWATMFTCFMLALTRTTTANTLVVNALSPLFAAILAWFVLKQPIARRTAVAIVVAMGGMAWMFHAGLAGDERALSGTLIAFAVPIAAAINVVTLKRVGHDVDLVPAVLIGALLSALVTLPVAAPFAATAHDILILALLGFFQLGLPCMLMVRASRHLAAPELALLTLLEVIQGPLWSWLFAGEAISGATLTGGAIVLGALALNELYAWQTSDRRGR